MLYGGVVRQLWRRVAVPLKTRIGFTLLACRRGAHIHGMRSNPLCHGHALFPLHDIHPLHEQPQAK